MPSPILRLCLLLLAVLRLLPAAPELASRHFEWLNGPPAYLITKNEKEVFLALQTDQERDGFIERFWEVRNPLPSGGAENEFKAEFWRRVAFANSFYGKDAGSEGWRTDRGRTYILFGKPRSTNNFSGSGELFPAELWFYANPGLAELPPFFYVMFFDRDGIGTYRFYHPYVHGPDKLIRGGPTKAQAFRYLKQINNELAAASLTLIPGEPLDTQTYAGSMSSAAIMNAIQGFNEMPSYVALITERAQKFEQVRSKIEYKLGRASLLSFVAHESGEPWLHWQIEIYDPEHPPVSDGKVQFEISAKLFSGDTLVYDRKDTPSLPASEEVRKRLQSRPFIYQDRMPVAPGKYRLVVSASNRASSQIYEVSEELAVEPAGDRPGLSEILVISRHEPDRRPRPFQFGGHRFSPMAAPYALASRGLNLLYQVTVPEPRPKELEIEYVVADAVIRSKKAFSEKLDLSLADVHGSVLTSKTLPIQEFSPGNYQVVVRVKDPATGKIAGRSVRFTIAADFDQTPPIVVAPMRPSNRSPAVGSLLKQFKEDSLNKTNSKVVSEKELNR